MKIVIVCEATRPDLFSFLLNDNRLEVSILTSKKNHELLNCRQYGYHEFNRPEHLFQTINPDKIVFYEIFDIIQVAICIEANYLNIPSVFLEHGISGSIDFYNFQEKNKAERFIQKSIKALVHLKGFIKNRMFFYSVLFKTKNISKILKFYLYLELYGPFYALRRVPFLERIPQRFILFSKNNLNYKNSIYHFLSFHNKVSFVGNPHIDKYSGQESNYFVFIDDPYLEQNLNNWTKEFHQNMVDAIYRWSNHNQVQLVIKLHPTSNIENWQREDMPQNIKIVQKDSAENLNRLYAESKMIIGFSSTLLVGFLSNQKNVVLLGWHPEPQIYGVDFSKYGICHTSFDMEDLHSKWNYWLENNLSISNLEGYQMFLDEFNAPFDGQAQKRIIEEIIND